MGTTLTASYLLGHHPGMPIAICGVHEVPTFAGASLDCIISIRDHRQPAPDLRAFGVVHPLPAVHSFVFDDTGDSSNPRAATEATIQRLLDIYAATPASHNILFHCYAGVSRSTAAAFIWLVNKGAPYGIAYETVVAVRGPFIAPNQLMVSLADRLMGRGGEMAAFLSAELGRRAPERERWFAGHR